MRAPTNYTQVVERKRYSTATATLLAGDDYWDGNNWERHGRNRFLYRTPKGSYFVVCLSQWQGEGDSLTPVTEGEAVQEFEGMREQRVEYAEAFPDVVIVEA